MLLLYQEKSECNVQFHSVAIEIAFNLRMHAINCIDAVAPGIDRSRAQLALTLLIVLAICSGQRR